MRANADTWPFFQVEARSARVKGPGDEARGRGYPRPFFSAKRLVKGLAVRDYCDTSRRMCTPLYEANLDANTSGCISFAFCY